MKRPTLARRRSAHAGVQLTYRCPEHLILPLTEARFQMRLETRTELITRALEAYLKKKGFWKPEPETAAPMAPVPIEEGAQA
jgi:hypothetical protein